jgi:fused signal recognition particle receptor
MTGTELAYLLIALAVIAIFLFLIRRASEKQSSESARKVRERLTERREGKERERAPETREVEERAEEEEEEVEPGFEEEEGEAEDEEEAPQEDAGERAAALQRGLSRTRGGFVARLGRLFSRKKIDEDVLDELEQVLFTADIGPRAADKLFRSIKEGMSRDELADPDAIWSRIREESATILSVDARPLDFSRARPFVLLMIGVNGVGKTTTIGKIAAKLTRQDKKVLLGAGDTFRAAATEQLEIWGDRAHAPVVKGKSGGDPSSVLFDTIKRGVDEDHDVVICDTAGRLHTKTNLMEELKKVGRVCDKAMPGAPHETWLVLDATTGQNAIQQAQMFKEAMDITGIVLTKLDGTAKGGVILGICDELQVPVRYIGIGESIDDLREFDANAFVSALYAQADTTEAA